MKRILGLILLLVFPFSLFAQRLELAGGINRNSFFDWKGNNPHSSAEYTSDYGYGVKLAIDKLGGYFSFLRLSIGYESYNGTANFEDGSLGGSSTMYIDMHKSIFSVGVHPFSFEFKNKLNLSIGFEYGWLLNESYTGHTSGWVIGLPPNDFEYDFDNTDPKYKNYNEKSYFGMCGRIGYVVHLSNTWTLLPQYALYWGWKDEFSYTKSFRQYASIGLRYQWNKP